MHGSFPAAAHHQPDPPADPATYTSSSSPAATPRQAGAAWPQRGSSNHRPAGREGACMDIGLPAEQASRYCCRARPPQAHLSKVCRRDPRPVRRPMHGPSRRSRLTKQASGRGPCLQPRRCRQPQHRRSRGRPERGGQRQGGHAQPGGGCRRRHVSASGKQVVSGQHQAGGRLHKVAEGCGAATGQQARSGSAAQSTPQRPTLKSRAEIEASWAPARHAGRRCHAGQEHRLR